MRSKGTLLHGTSLLGEKAMYSLKSWFLWCALPALIIGGPLMWLAHTESMEQKRATSACIARGMSPVLDPQRRIVCAVVVRP